MKTTLLEQQKIKYEINGILWKKRDFATCHKNAVNYLLPIHIK
jgi:hypothetical protein